MTDPIWGATILSPQLCLPVPRPSVAPCAFLVQLRVQPTAARLNPAEVRLLCRHPTAVQAHCCCAVGWSLQPTWAWKLRNDIGLTACSWQDQGTTKAAWQAHQIKSRLHKRIFNTSISPIKYLWKWDELYTSVSFHIYSFENFSIYPV